MEVVAKVPNTKGENKNSKKLLLSLMLLFTSILLFWLAIKSDEEVNSENDQISLQQSEDRVNSHLKNMARKIETQKIKAQIETFAQTPNSATDLKRFNESDSQSGLDFKADPRIDELAESLGKKTKEPAAPKDPKEIIQAQVYDQQKWNEYNLAYREAYAERFVENARRNGWIVKLNDDYKVISAKPIKKDSRPQIFQNNSAIDSRESRSGN